MFTFFPGGFLIGRTVAVLITMTIGTSMAARQGPLAMAAHQICMQVWLAVSLLTDGLAASGQVYTPRIAPYARNLMWFVSNGLSFLPTSIIIGFSALDRVGLVVIE
ncbi:protein DETOXIFICATION 45, chloroplastic-like [Spinacia oleracea]|uniref:Protein DETOXIFICATION 45, chloroplastic-like n=1 Tax=Spinacia oleracea TaxID=3562 RepID=A0ABM3QI18_SPIOL|nr:protein DETOXIFICATION 45, chloroplastic-like [Spinacia oleracea]